MSFEMLASPFFTIQGNKSSIPLELHHDQDPSDFLFGTAGILPSPPPSSLAPAKRKRRRRPKICKNQEEVENQRMTHIAVERNRRRQMNEHLSVLRSLMPDSYMQRGDQASIVGGAIEFVKELEHLLQSLEAHKRRTQKEQEGINAGNTEAEQPPFAQFFVFPQYSWRQARRDFAARPAAADIEVSLIETHASLRILSPRRPRQLVQLVAGLQLLRLSVLHLNLTTVDAMVLYSLSLKVDEGCSLTTVDDIAAAVHHLLSLIDAETTSAVPD